MSEHHPLHGQPRGRGSKRPATPSRWSAELVRDACVDLTLDPYAEGMLYRLKVFVRHDDFVRTWRVAVVVPLGTDRRAVAVEAADILAEDGIGLPDEDALRRATKRRSISRKDGTSPLAF